MLNQNDMELISRLKKEANEAFDKQDPNLRFKLAGMALSNGGHQKIIEVLDQNFLSFLEASKKLPENFTLTFSPEDVFDVKIKALFYIFADQYRPTGGIALLPSARAEKKAYNERMDQRLLMAAFEVHRCELLLQQKQPFCST